LHVLGQNDDIFAWSVLDVVPREQFFYFVFQPLFVALATISVSLFKLLVTFVGRFVVIIIIFLLCLGNVAEVQAIELYGQ